MTIPLAPAATLVLRTLRLGPLRLTSYGLCAAVGLLLGMAVARRCAMRAGLDPERAWDAGLFAIVSCFVASRLLLMLNDPAAFVRFPLLVLSLPSLTFGGMGVAVLMLWAYLRRKRLALLPLLDVYAPGAALLAASLELGHALEGSEVGMPTSLPWAVRDPWSPTPLRVHPVALYGVAASLLLCAWLWRRLAPPEARQGRVAAAGLFFGGMMAYALNLITQPLAVAPGLWLEPGQWIAFGAMLAGGLLWLFAPPSTGRVPPLAVTSADPADRSPGTVHDLQKEAR